MNRIFKSIWNAKTRTFVAVSELTAARGKPATTSTGAAAGFVSAPGRLRALCATLLGAGLLSHGLAMAQQQIIVGDSPAVEGSVIRFVGPGSINFQNGGTITGLSNGALAAGSTDAVTGGQLFQVNSALDTRITGLGTDLTSLGTNLTDLTGRVTTVEGDVLDLTSRVTTTEGNVTTITSRVDTLESQLYTAGDGVKYFRVNSELADASAQGENAIAVGPQAVATGDNAVAVGSQASAADENAVAVGSQASAAGENAAAFGSQASAAGNNAVALGSQASASANAEGGVALGQNAAAGSGTHGQAAIAIGRNSQAAGDQTLALGDGATIDSPFAANAMAVGTGARVDGVSANALALGTEARAGAGNAAALGTRAVASAGNTVAIGNEAYANAIGGIAIGTQAGQGTNGNAAGDRTSQIAIGTQAGQNVVGNQTTAIGYQAGNNVEGDWNVALGAQAGTGLNGDENVAIGFQANQNAGTVEHATVLGSRANAGTDAVALGYRASAASNGSVALGTEASVTSGLGVAIGRQATASGDNVALGTNAVALPTDATGNGYLTGSSFTGGTVVSVGDTANNLKRRIVNVADGAQATDAVNVGQLRSAQTSVANLVGGVSLNPDGSYSQISVQDASGQTYQFNSVTEALNVLSSGTIDIMPSDAVRYNAQGQINNVTAGTLGTDAVNVQQLNEVVAANGMRYVSVNSTGLGNEDNSGATGSNAIAIGAEAGATGVSGLALGHAARSQANEAVAVGRDTQALGDGSSALGNGSIAYDTAAVAIGRDAISRGENSLVMGTGAQADRKTPNASVNNAIVFGTIAEVTADDGIAIGRSALASELRGIAQGTDAHSQAVDATAIGTSSLATGTSAQALGTSARGYATNAVALGNNAISGRANPDPDDVADNINTIAIGTATQALGRNATAVGRETLSTGNTSLAVGDANNVSGNQASALGNASTVSGARAIALGSSNQVAGARAGALGTDNTVTAQNAYAIGNDNTLEVSNAFILGNNASVANAGGVALGTGSASSTAGGRQGYNPNAAHAPNVSRINATTSTTGAVAVGSATVRRQITGVAAGTADTDAVNVAQLRSTGWNVRTDGDAATHVSTGEAHTVDIGLAPNETNLLVSRSTVGTETTIDYALAKNLDLGPTGSVRTGDTFVDTSGLTVTNGAATTQVRAGNVQVSGGTNTVVVNGTAGTVNGLTNRTFDPAAIVNGQAATEDQLGQVNQDLIDRGFALQGADGNTVLSPLGEAIPVVGGDTNIVTEAVNGELLVSLADDVDVARDLTVGGAATVQGPLGVAGNTTLQGTLGVTGLSTLTGGAVIGSSLTVNPNTTIAMGGNRVTAVAAGVDDTDAVNVSQLNDVATRPITFTGNTGSVERTLGQTLAVEGGLATTAAASSDNLRTRVDGETLVLEMAEDLNLTSLNIRNGGPRISATGINMNGQKITELADGTEDSDAVNLGQLRDVQDTASLGWNLGTNGDPATQVAPGATVDLGNTDGNIVLTQDGTDVRFDLADDVAVARDLTVGGAATVQGPLGVAGNTTLQGTLGVTGLSTLTGGAVIGSSLTVNPNTTIAMGGNRVTAVAAGVDDTDAVNVSQLNDVATRPITFTGNTGSVERTLGQTLAVEGGLATTAAASSDNLRTRVDGETLVLEMAEDLNLTSLNIRNGGPRISATGINMNGQKISELADGTEDSDAVNLGQLREVQETAELGWNLGTNGDPATQVAPGATVDLDNTDGNIVLTQDGTDVRFDLADDVAVARDLTVGGAATVQGPLSVAGNTTLQGDLGVTGLSTFTGGAVIGGSLTVNPNTTIAMGGNRITEVAAGVDDTDAVNVSQLNDVSNRPITFTGNTGSVERTLGQTLAVEGGLDTAAAASSDNLRTRVDGETLVLEMAEDLNLTSLNIRNGGPRISATGIAMNGQQISGLAAGTENDHAVNLSQLRGVQETAELGWNLGTNGAAPVNVAPGAAVDFSSGDGNVAIEQSGTNVRLRLADNIAINNNLTVGGDTIIGGHTTLTGGVSVSNSFSVAAGTTINMGGNRIQNVARGVDPTDAVNVSQLQEVQGGVDRLQDRAVVYDGNIGDPKDRVTLAGETSTDGGRTGGTTITNLARGEISATSTDAVNGSQIHEIGTDIANGLGGNSSFVDGRLVTELNVGGNTYTNVNDALVGVNQNVENVSEVANRGWDLQVNGDTASKVAPGSTVQFIEGENVTITRDGLDVTVDVARDLNVDSVTAKEVAIEDGPTLNQRGLDMANQRINNVAEGISPNDAVNLGQLNRLADGMGQQVNRLDARINLAEKRADAGTAAAMATASLPQAYLPGKSMFALGGGTWNGETGFALGLSTVSDNGKWVVKGSGASSSRGDFGAAVGVGYQW